ncbi:E3 ubiquitin-protein ligase RNF12-B-like [Rana temporaria]|uniref:E3 ubiquitin-protein ligase RNF12-B-like n=1 Tax=Rana temporaria TaxID=8407 RepID=UPI001AACBC8F|nr:E3 ubiquitin-protein ligase RNF12-B-like [Rana temporaria]
MMEPYTITMAPDTITMAPDTITMAPDTQSELVPDPQSESVPDPQSELVPDPQSELVPDPQSELVPDPQSESAPDPQSELVPDPQSELVPDPQSELVPGTQSELVPDPQSELVPDPQSELVPDPQSELVPDPQSELVPDPQSELVPDTQSELVPDPQSELVPDPQSELVPDPQSELVPDPQSELVPDPQSESVPDPQSELVPGTTLQLISEKQPEISSDPTTVLEADITTAKTESDPTPPPLPTKSSPPVPTTTLSPIMPTTISSTTTSEQILDLTPPSPEDSSIGSPQTPRDSSPQIGLGTTDNSRSILLATTMEHTSLDQSADHSNVNTQPTETQNDDKITEEPGRQSNTDPPLTTPKSPGDYTVSAKTDKILERIVQPTPERPSNPLGSPSPLQATSDQTFYKDGPNTGEVPTMATSSSKRRLDEGVSVLVDKDHPRDSPVPPKPLHLLISSSKDLRKGQKDTKNPNSEPKTTQKLNKEKEKSKQKSNLTFIPKKDRQKAKFFSKGVKWAFKSGLSERSYLGNHVSSPGLGQAHRSAACPYPCLQQAATFPLYQTNVVSPWGGQLHHDRSSVKAKKPCKPFGYKRGVYSLYLPSNTMEENLTPPRRDNAGEKPLQWF